jgi:cellulose synthase/poly-beta-1,6-N-acetylglucosamine synthase-like glycosyltransferase
METVLIILVYLFTFLVIYPFAIYPALLFLLRLFKSKKVNRDLDFKPELTFLISAYNEEENIENCINSILNSNYPKEKIKIIVGSDGSSDKTNSILKTLNTQYANLDYIVFNRIGKNNVLSELIKKTETEYIYFLDADMEIPENTISNIVSYMADSSVGAAFCNILMTHDTKETGGLGEKLYQMFEKFLRINESKIFSTVNSFGACFVRRELIKDGYPDDKVLDDNYTILKVSSQGKRVIFDSDNIIYEKRPKILADEFQRRIRMIAAGLSTFLYFKEYLFFKKGTLSFFLYSHKIIRIFSPLYLILILVFSLLLEHTQFGKNALLIQFLFYSSVFAGYAFDLLKAKIRIFKIPLFYFVMNVSFIFGILRFISGKQNSIWGRKGF